VTSCYDSYPEFKRVFEAAEWMCERAVLMSEQARGMYSAAIQATIASIEMRERHARMPAALGPYRISRSDYRAMLTVMLDKAIALTGADMGNIQLLNPGLRTLNIEVERGFDRVFLEFFGHVHCGQCACGAAMERMSTVVVEDVTRSPIFRDAPTLEVMLDARARAVQSSPLVSSSGAILGVLSTHYGKPRSPDQTTLRSIEFLKHCVAEFIEICVPLPSVEVHHPSHYSANEGRAEVSTVMAAPSNTAKAQAIANKTSFSE
jgi:hypothetical protein